VDAGYGFSVEYNDQLGTGPWLNIGPGSVSSDNGTLQSMKALLPAGTSGKRFARLKITTPP